MRVVYSFSVPDMSVAHFQLKQWKAQGVVISQHLQKLIEGDGSKVLELEARVEAQTFKLKHQAKVLNHILACNPDLVLPSDFEEAVV